MPIAYPGTQEQYVMVGVQIWPLAPPASNATYAVTTASTWATHIHHHHTRDSVSESSLDRRSCEAHTAFHSSSYDAR